MTDQLPARRGPRPMALHLWAAMNAGPQARVSWPAVLSGRFPWRPDLAVKAASIAEATRGDGATSFDAALDRETRRRFDRFLAGIDAYRRHPYRRSAPEPPCVWREGTTRLLDYGVFSNGAGQRGTLLVIPSLVNRYYVLDLDSGSSLVRHLARLGFRPIVVDWDAPGADERGYALTDYIAGRLDRALDAAVGMAGGPVSLIGYCMGGLLATALAHRRAADIPSIALLATPWDFHVDTGSAPPLLAAGAAAISAFLDRAPDMPVDMLQAFFFALDPMQGWTKFRNFAGADPGSPGARQFVALEDWANDGVPLAAAVARECLLGWYVENSPARGLWRVGGTPVRPGEISRPALVVVPARDRIVPPESARALAHELPNATTLTPPAGHVGMVVGSRAETGLWQPLGDWLARNGAPAA